MNPDQPIWQQLADAPTYEDEDFDESGCVPSRVTLCSSATNALFSGPYHEYAVSTYCTRGTLVTRISLELSL